MKGFWETCKWISVGLRFIIVKTTEFRKADGFNQGQRPHREQNPEGGEKELEAEPKLRAAVEKSA